MFLFGKNKKEDKTPPPPPAPVQPAAPAQPAPAPAKVSADDFFGDLDKKPKPVESEPQTGSAPVIKPEPEKADIIPPSTDELRDAPPPVPPSNMNDVSTSEIDIGILPDKTLIPPPVPFEIEEPEEPQKPRSDGDDFFADLDRKKQTKKVNKGVVAPPSTESLRDAPPPPPPTDIHDVAAEVTNEALPEKHFDDMYHGDMNDAEVDEEGAAALEFKHFKEQREEDGSLDYDNEVYSGIDIESSKPVEVEAIEE